MAEKPQNIVEQPILHARKVFKWTLYLILAVFGTVVFLIVIDLLNNVDHYSGGKYELEVSPEASADFKLHNTPSDTVSPYVSDLESRVAVKAILSTSATVFFMCLAYGTAFSSIGSVLMSYIGEAGNFILTSALVSAGAGAGIYCGVSIWEWYKCST